MRFKNSFKIRDYYPLQTKDECLIFVQYDTKPDVPKFAFHTAFDDPNSPNNCEPRRSIEARCHIIFNEESHPYAEVNGK